MMRLGQKLHEERVKRKLSFEDVEKATKIRASFLVAIEKGEYHKLPSSAYALGFVRNYVEYLGLPKKETLALFRREFDEEKELKVLPEGFAKERRFPSRSLRIGRAILLIGALFLLLAGYLFYQYRHAFFDPKLTVAVPKEGETVAKDLTVSGETDVNASVFVNNETATVDASGTFMKKITVFPGKVNIVIQAKNKYGRETIIERQVKVK